MKYSPPVVDSSKGVGTGGMSTRYELSYGKRITNDGRTNPPTITEDLMASKNDSLYGIYSELGDHKTPNNQTFTHEVTTFHNGLIRSNFPDGTSVAITGTLNNIFNIKGAGLYHDDENGAYSDALSALCDSVRGQLDLSIDLFERRKTARMVRDAAKAVVMFKSTIKKMARSNPRDWGSLWLQYTYGWRPLANSIYGFMDRVMDPTRPFAVFVGRGYDRYVDSERTEVWENVFETHSVDYSSRCEIKVALAFTQSRLEELSGYTSLNPVSIAWELMPYSFVVDWFVNVGGYLRALETAILHSGNFVSGYVTYGKRTVSIDALAGTFVDLPNDVSHTYKVLAGFRGTKKRRERLSSFPYPRFPIYRPKLGSSRLISAAALLSQQLSSLKRR